MILFIRVINNYMSYKVRAVYTKPNAEMSLHTAPAGLFDLVDTMFDEGKIIQKPVKTIDGLNETFEIIFADKAAFDEWNDNVVVTDNYFARLEHCNANSISYSVEAEV